MALIVFILFGLIFLYAGVLTLPQSTSGAIVLLFLGIVLMIRPVKSLLQSLRGTPSNHPQDRKGRRRKSHLTVVQSDKNKPPTYH